jgi:hypothetical protein
MPKASFDPKEFCNPLRDGAEKIAQFLEQASGPGIESVYCEQNSKGLFVSVSGERERRYQLAELDASNQNSDRQSPNGAERTLTLEQLLQLNLASPPTVIDGLIHEGETVVVAGRQKVGKSRLTQQMALCLANGEPFLGMNVPRARRVFMVDLENGLGSLSQRFRAMGGARGGDRLLSVWCAQSLDSVLPDASPDGAERLCALVDDVTPDVLIIDPWRLWLGKDENNAVDIVAGLKILASIRRHHPRIVIVIVHHVRKEKFESPKRLLSDPSLWADAVSGHHALMSHVDACFGLERQSDDGENALIVFGGIARNALPSTLILDEDDSLRFKVAANEDAALKVMTKAQREIWNKIKGLRQFGFNQAVTAAKTTNKKAVSATLKTAVSHGLVLKNGDSYVRVQA